MTESMTRRHPDDAHLVRLLDGELTDSSSATIGVHIEGCERCAARLRHLRERSAGLDRLLDESAAAMEPPPLLQHRGIGSDAGGAVPLSAMASTWWRVAAAIVLLLGLGLLAPPVRAWVVDQVGVVTALLDDSPAAVPDEPAMLLRLPAAPRLVVEVIRPASGAVLELRRGGEGDAVLEVVSRGADVVVTSDGVRLEGGPPGAVYRLEVPLRVRTVELRSVEDGQSVQVEVPAEGAVRVPLDSREPR